MPVLVAVVPRRITGARRVARVVSAPQPMRDMGVMEVEAVRTGTVARAGRRTHEDEVSQSITAIPGLECTTLQSLQAHAARRRPRNPHDEKQGCVVELTPHARVARGCADSLFARDLHPGCIRNGGHRVGNGALAETERATTRTRWRVVTDEDRKQRACERSESAMSSCLRHREQSALAHRPESPTS
ncbi:hypothetical protein DFH09DRAFT_1284267 [Mycena vulgaris]|nr:hypothetical protein DFH09DRAFT_1284267 [Mycena vulgaris]